MLGFDKEGALLSLLFFAVPMMSCSLSATAVLHKIENIRNVRKANVLGDCAA